MDNYPAFVTIIVPTRNEARYIQYTLESIFSQDYPKDDYEIIVVDGCSTDQTREIIRNYQSIYSNLSLINNPKKIVPTALNIGFHHSKGDIIIRVDGHCEIAPDYVKNCVRHLIDEDIDGIGGPIDTDGETEISKTIAIAMSSTFGVGDSAFRTVKDRSMIVDSVAFPAYKRETIEKVGLFDEELLRNQDDEYNYRIRKLGGKILLSPDIRSVYYSRASLIKLWSQYYQYGFWKVRVLQKHPRQMCFRQFVPPVFVVSLLGSIILALFWTETKFITGMIVGSYIVANLTASIWTAYKRGWKNLVLLPIVYATLHLSYGLGFLVGLVRFIHRWGDKDGKVPKVDEIEIGSTKGVSR